MSVVVGRHAEPDVQTVTVPVFDLTLVDGVDVQVPMPLTVRLVPFLSVIVVVKGELVVVDTVELVNEVLLVLPVIDVAPVNLAIV